MNNEHQHQVAFINYCNLKGHPYNLVYAIANGGQRHPGVARKLKAEGVKPGIPDIHLPVARKGYHGLYIEMKWGKNGLTEKQKSMHELLSKEGNLVLTCYGFDEAKAAIDDYLMI